MKRVLLLLAIVFCSQFNSTLAFAGTSSPVVLNDTLVMPLSGIIAR